jgi:hypothetical protein
MHFCRADWQKELPDDVLEKIAGFMAMDVRALCTARLLCKPLCQFASGHLKALQLDCTALEQPPTSSSTRLSGLTRVEVSVKRRNRICLITHANVAPVITYVDLQQARPDDGPESVDNLNLLPNLRSLSLHVEPSKIKFLPTGLEELRIKYYLHKDVSSLTQISALTTLEVALTARGELSFGRLTSLLNLRSLNMRCGLSTLRVITTFSMVTSLTWRVDSGESPQSTFPGLGQLTKLSYLKVVDYDRDTRRVHLA